MSCIRKAWDQIALFMSLKGLELPGLDAARARLSPNERAAHDRQLLVREIKTTRVLLGRGPLGWRRLRAAFSTIFLRYRGLVGLALKAAVGVFVVLLPLTFFVVVRGILPVPRRVPFANTAATLPRVSTLHTSFPYTETMLPRSNSPSTVNFLPPTSPRGKLISFDNDASRMPGLVRFSVGSYPAHLREFRGFLVAEGADVVVPQQKSEPTEILGRNRLILWTHLVPLESGAARCRLEIRDNHGKLLVATEADARNTSARTQSSLAADFRERLLPAYFSNPAGIEEFLIESDRAPTALHLSVTQVGNSTNTGDLRFPELSQKEISEQIPQWAGGALRVRDVSSAPCIFGVGHMAFERQLLESTARRGVVFVTVDGLRQSLAKRADLMPNLNRFAAERGTWLENHFSQGNDTTLAMSALWMSRPVRNFQDVVPEAPFPHPQLDTEKHAARYFQRAGYRVAAIGHISDEDTSAFEDVTVIENRHYETRSITEEAGAWLEEKGSAPFFLYLHYGTLQSPFRPPFEDLDVTKFLSSPFGLSAEEALEEGLARFWDKEFALLLRKLELTGLSQKLDIVVVGAYGNQMTPMSYRQLIPKHFEGKWASRSKSVLTRDELHVPLIFSVAGFSGGKNIAATTAHIDIAPTLAALLSLKRHPDWQGISVFPEISGTTNAQLRARQWLYADARYAAAVFETLGTQEKYVANFQTGSITLFSDVFPWRKTGKLSAGEIYSRITPSGHEDFVSPPPESRQSQLREALQGYWRSQNK